MNLFAIIEEKEKNRYTELYLSNGRLGGFTFDDGKIERVDCGFLKDVFDMFLLGKNRVSLGRDAGCEKILDKDTGLVHYFEDGMENYDLLIVNNGIDFCKANLFYRENLDNGDIRRYVFKKAASTVVVICLTISLLPSMLTQMFKEVSFFKNGERVNLFDYVDFVLEKGWEGSTDFSITPDDIRSYIYMSEEIKSNRVKDFLWNEELIDDVVPYYDGTYLSFVTRLRHEGIEIDRDVSRWWNNGEYRFGHTLHVKGFIEEKFDEKDMKAKTLGHEYVHLLQCNCYPFICEASAELIAREYFMNSSSSKAIFSYGEECRCLAIIMEIIGSEPVWENNFKANSTLFEDSVRPYLTEEEVARFISIMNFNPNSQPGQFKHLKDELLSLLNTIHINKYGHSMYKNPVIKAILDGAEFDRVYFRNSLREIYKDSFVTSILAVGNIKDVSIVSIEALDGRVVGFGDSGLDKNTLGECLKVFDCHYDGEAIYFDEPVRVFVPNLSATKNILKNAF